MGKRATDPCFEAGLIIRHESAPRQPGAIEPLQAAHFEVEPAADFELRHHHRGEAIASDFTLRGESVRLDRDVITAIVKRCDLGIVPLITQPLPIGEPAVFGPAHEALGSLDRTVTSIGLVHPDIGHGARGQIPNLDTEPIGILARRQAFDMRGPGGLRDDRLELRGLRWRRPLRSKSRGGTPKRRRKLREKSDDDEKPHASAIAVSDSAGSFDIIKRAFSSRSRLTKSLGVEPTIAWKTR